MTSSTANNVREQLAMWNSIIMHDGTGQFVNLYEVDSMQNIYDRPVVKISQTSFEDNKAGLFNWGPNNLSVQLDIFMNVDTPLHEFGHVLGLWI